MGKWKGPLKKSKKLKKLNKSKGISPEAFTFVEMKASG
jgi:hypothetical protein